MTIPSYDIAGQDYILRALTSSRSSGFGTPAYAAVGGDPVLVSSVNATRVTTAAIACTAPATITAGNLLVAIAINTSSSSITWTAPSGWTLNKSQALGTGATLAIYTKVATGSEPASYTFTASAAAGQQLTILNYSNAGALITSYLGNIGNNSTATSTVYPNSKMFLVCVRGDSNATSISATPSVGSFNNILNVTTDPHTVIYSQNLLYDVTVPTSVTSTINIGFASNCHVTDGIILPKDQLTYFDTPTVQTQVTTSDWQVTSRTVVTGKANTTLYVNSGDIQLSKDNTNWSNYVSASIGDTVYVRSRIVGTNNLVAGLQTLNVYCNNDQVMFQYILDANIQLSASTNISSATALSYVYEPTGRTVSVVGTDTITATNGQVRKNSTGTWGTSVDVVTGDTLNFRVTASATRDLTTTATISSTRLGASLFTVAATTSSYIGYTTSGSSTFTVPLGVNSVCIACIGAGGGGVGTSATTAGAGGGAGALSYTNNVAVTSGESLTVTRGTGGTVSTADGAAGAGGLTSVARGATTLVSANGGSGGSGTTGGAGGTTTGTGTVKFAGGAGASANSASLLAGGGGNTATRSANGSAGTQQTLTKYGGDGGLGQYTSSTGWITSTGLAGTSGGIGGGGVYGAGGGGGSGDGVSVTGVAGSGGTGGVVIIWNGRIFSPASTF